MTAVDTEPRATEVAADTLLRIENLRVGFSSGADVVSGVDLELKRGEILAIVGESGSGKSVTSRSLVGLAGNGAHVRADRFDLFGEPALKYAERDWRALRGNRIGLVLQDALTSLDPLRTIRDEIAEALGRGVPRARRDERIDALLSAVGLPDVDVVRRKRSFQLSGGQRQRALIASALARDPDILIADEPTTALDVTVQAQVLTLLVDQVRGGRSLILVSHDLAVVSSIADRVIVLQDGRVQESGPVRRVIDHPAAAYTQQLLASVPSGTAGPFTGDRRAPVFSADGIGKAYRVLGRHVDALRDVSIEVAPGENLGIVGESGSGKSTLAKIVTGIVDSDTGSMQFGGSPLTRHDREPGRIALVAQDSVASFDPRYRVADIIGEAVALHAPKAQRTTEIARLLDSVHLPASTAERHPRELSGGQRQRVNIARALGSRPRLVVCDEPVSALDISVQAQILDLLAELTGAGDAAFLFISHDLTVVRQLCQSVVVLHRGVVVDRGDTDTVFDAPSSPYTRHLIDAIPQLRTHPRRRTESLAHHTS